MKNLSNPKPGHTKGRSVRVCAADWGGAGVKRDTVGSMQLEDFLPLAPKQIENTVLNDSSKHEQSNLNLKIFGGPKPAV